MVDSAAIFNDFSNTQAFVNSTPLIETPVVKGFDDMMNKLVGAFDQSMTALTAFAGEKIGSAADKASQVVSDGAQAFSARETPGEKGLEKGGQELQRDIGAPEQGMNKNVQEALSNVKWPPGVENQQPVHIEAAQLTGQHEQGTVSKSALIVGGNAKTEEAGMSMNT